MSQGALAGTGDFLRIEEDGTLIAMKGEISRDDQQMIEEGTLTIVRFIPFSPEAQKVAGAPGRWEQLTVDPNELQTEPESEDEDDSGVEPESDAPLQTYTLEWDPI